LQYHFPSSPSIFSIVHLFVLRGLPLGRLSIVIPKISTIWLRNSSAPIGCRGRTASYLTTPAQIPACGTTALGSSEILASVKDKLVLPSLLFPAVRFAFVIQSNSLANVILCRLSIGFRYGNNVAICINLYLRGYNSLLGSTGFPMAYLFPCVRFI
jgi:hypothetical protein